VSIKTLEEEVALERFIINQVREKLMQIVCEKYLTNLEVPAQTLGLSVTGFERFMGLGWNLCEAFRVAKAFNIPIALTVGEQEEYRHCCDVFESMYLSSAIVKRDGVWYFNSFAEDSFYDIEISYCPWCTGDLL